MSYITKSVDVDVDIDYDELDVDDLIKALEWHEKNGMKVDKDRIKEFRSSGIPLSKQASLNDVLKLEAFNEGKDNKTLAEIQNFFS